MDSNKSANHHDYESKREIIYFSVWSLKNMAAVIVVGGLWKQPDLISDLQEHINKFGRASKCCSYGDSGTSFHQMEGKVLEKLSRLPLPLQLKETTLNMIRPVGLELLEWIDPSIKHSRYVYHFGYMSTIFFSLNGTIIESIKVLDCHLDVYFESVYKRACKHCWEDDIPEVWWRLSKGSQNRFLYKDYKSYGSHFVAYWTCFLSNQLPKLLNMITSCDPYNIYDINHSIYYNMVELSTYKGNLLSIKYFWPKLKEHELNNTYKWTKRVIEGRKHATKYSNYQETNVFTDLLFFLLSQMNYEEQRNIFQKYSEVILGALFSDWPWQKYLLPTVRVMWDYLEEKVYLDLLLNISSEIKEGRTTEKLLRNVLSGSPIHLKQCFVQNSKLCAIVLKRLLQVEDTITIRQILNYPTTEEKYRIYDAISQSGEEIFQLMNTGKLYLLSMLIEETFSMETDIRYFKKSLILKHGKNLCHSWIFNDNWKTLEKFLAWAFSTQNQISTYKRTLDRVYITAALVRQDNYELVDKFMNWCFYSEKGINQFKKKLLYGELKLNGYILGILELLCDCEWDVYEKLINWCCKSNKGIGEFKMHISQYNKMESIMRHVIGSKYNFEFAEKLLRWCYDSYEEVKQFKAKLSLSSQGGIKMIGNFVQNTLFNHEHNNWELVKEQFKFLCPLEKSVVTEMKREFERQAVYYSNYYGNKTSGPLLPNLEIKQKELFQLLDSFAADQDESNNESDSRDENRDVISRFGEKIYNDGGCSIITDVVGTLSNIMDICTDVNNDEGCNNFECEDLNEEDTSLPMDVV